MVYAYHFATSETIDVDIIEQRNPGKMLQFLDHGEQEDEGQDVIPPQQRGILKRLGFDQIEFDAKTPFSSTVADIVFKPSDYE